MSESEVMRYVAAASDGHGYVDARKLVSELGAVVFPSDPDKAVGLAFEAMKKTWIKTWPKPISVTPSRHGGVDGGSILRVILKVSAKSEAERSEHRNAIESKMLGELMSLGVGSGERMDFDVYVVVDGG